MKGDRIRIYLAGLLVAASLVLVWLVQSSVVLSALISAFLLFACILFFTTFSRLRESIEGDKESAKSSKELLNRKLSQYEMLLQNSPTVLCIKDQDGKYIYVNGSFEEKAGKPKDEILGMSAGDVLPEEVAKRDHEGDLAALESEKGAEYEIFLPGEDGNPQHLWVSKRKAEVGHTGEFNIIGYAWDITRVKETEDHLKRLLSALEQSPVSVVITDMNGDIEYVNSYFCKASGYSREELLGANPRVLKSGHQSGSFYKEMWRCIQSGLVWKGDFINVRKNGEEYCEQAAIAPVYDDSGTISHFVGVKEDVTEQRNAQRNLEKARLNAELANRAKNTFLAKMSRELRTPLNTIMGYSQILKDDTSITADNRKVLRSIHRSGRDLIQIINNVLEMSRIESGRYELSKNPFRVEHTLKDLVQMFANRANEKGVKLQLQLDPDLSPRVVQDEPKVRLILSNLLRNAVNFTKAGRIQIRYTFSMSDPASTEPSDAPSNGTTCFLIFEVEDTGIGVHSDDQQRIFESFEQTDDGKLVEGGSGLGLAISRHYARLMGGDVVLIKSEPGKGSLFKAYVMAELSGEHEQTEILMSQGGKTQQGSADIHVLLLRSNDKKSGPVLESLIELGYVVKTVDQLSEVEGYLHQRDIQYMMVDIGALSEEQLQEVIILGKLMNENGTALIGLLDGDSRPSKEQELIQSGWHPMDSDGVFSELRWRFDYKLFSLVRFGVDVSTGAQLDSLDAHRLPVEVRNDFIEAATTGDLGKLHSLIQTLAPEYAPLKELLHDNMNRFDFEAIVEAFKSQKDKHE